MNFKIAITCLFIGGVLSLTLNAQDSPEIIVEHERAVTVSFVIEGNPDSWYIYKQTSLQPLAGKRELQGNTLLFSPAIPFQRGIIYVIKREDEIKYKFSPPRTNQSQPKVVRINPTAENLPVNLLKFYIQFSEPMAEGNPYQSIHLVNAGGDTLNNIFLNQLPALWNKNRTVLSLWLDPGRIKRDLNLNKKRGNPLQQDASYNLIIDTTFKSKNGRRLQSHAQKKFRTTLADRKKPDMESWEMDTPDKGSRQPIVIYFGEPMDYLSTKDRIDVLIDDRIIKGKSQFRSSEKEWVFTPAEAWKAGSYTIRADARIEDLGGNNLNGLFDRNIKTQPRFKREFYTVEIEIQ